MTRDPLARHWKHPLIIRRAIGSGAYGTKYGQTEMIRGAIDGRSRMVRNAAGVEVVSSTTVAIPLVVNDVRVEDIPPGSEVTLPSTHGGRTTHVLDNAIGDGGDGVPTPNHIQLALE